MPEFEIPLEVRTDNHGDEFYVARPDVNATVDLNKATFLIFHPPEDGQEGTLIVKSPAKKGRRNQRRDPEKDKARFLAELRRAEARYDDGYLGLGLFLKQWRSSRLPAGSKARQKMIDELVDEGVVEIYDASDGKRAIRVLVDE